MVISDAIIVAVITGCLSLMGTYFANRKTAAIMEYKIGELEKKQEKHNSLIERTYKLEERMSVVENEIGDLKNV